MPVVYFRGYTPVASGNLILLERPRIYRLLEKAAESPVTRVTAGAGCGKTCAVYSFAVNSTLRAAWIQCSARDNSGDHFWKNFVSAVSLLSCGAADKLGRMKFPVTEEQFGRCLAAVRSEAVPNDRFILVYDDLHLITDAAALRFLERMLVHSFPGFSSVLISRTEPALNLEKLASRKLLAGLGEDELRFSPDEMDSYFRLRNVSPDPGLAASIYHGTEGWAFAVHLAGLSLGNVPGGASHVSQLLRASSFRLIESEIMAPLPPELRRFLIKLSLVEQLDPDLVREIGEGGALAEMMEKTVPFIRFDGSVYRIRRFFMEYLRERQCELDSEEKKDVLKKTALWYAANGRKTDAIICCERAGDYDGIVGVLNTLPLILPTGTARLVLKILDNAGETVYRDFPETVIIRGRSLFSLGRIRQGRKELLETIPKIRALPGGAQKHFILSACYMNLGIAGLIRSVHTRRYNFTCYFKRAALLARRSRRVTKPPLNGVTLSSHACRVSAPASKEDFDKYIGAIGEIVPWASEAMGGCCAGLYELCLGELAFYRDELGEAEKQLLACYTKAREKEQFETENRALFYLLRICTGRGNIRGIARILEQLDAAPDESLYPNRNFYRDIVSGWYHVQTGKTDRLAPWIKSDYLESELNSGVRLLEKLVKAKYFFYAKRFPAALAILNSSVNTEPLLLGDLEAKALEAVCRFRLANREGAFASLAEAYRLAFPLGVSMPFTELGKDMRAVTEAAIREKATDIPPEWLDETRRKAVEYAKKLYPLTGSARTFPGAGENRFLSRRELDVLIGFSRGLTREEIAGEASISPNTVKSVTRSIYNKLGALNKADAVRIAAEKGILEKSALS